MQRFIVMAAAALLLLLAACTQQRAPEIDRADLEYERVAQRQADYHAAMAARDASAIAEMFAADAVLHIANMPPVEGRQAIQQFYARMFGFLSEASATPETLVVSTSGDMAYGTGRTVNKFRGPEGPVSYAGKYALVWRKLGGEWRVTLYTVSSNHQ